MEKKFEASKERIKKARDEGQVAKSQDLLKLGALVVAFEVANLCYQPLLQSINHLFLMPSSLFQLPFIEAAERLVFYGLGLLLSVCLTSMLVIALVKILMTWGQSGFIFSLSPLKGGIKNLNPTKQLSQMFTLNKLWDLFASLIKLSVIIGLSLLIYRGIFQDLLGISQVQQHLVWPALHHLFLTFERTLLIALLIIAATDVIMQNYFYKRRLKMTDQEVRQERKNRDGNPHIKSKRRSLAQQLIMGPAQATMDAVKNADAVVVNPTHVAVALSYDPDKVPLPVVIFKSHDGEAKQTIAYAQEHDIPVIRYLWLARTLHAECEPGQAIPRETIQAAASLFKVLKKLKNAELDENRQGLDDIEEVTVENGVYQMGN